MSTKIFGIGLNKTGTSSLGAYFKSMGKKLLCRPKLLSNIHSSGIQSIKNLIDENDVFEDWPFPLYYQELYTMYPNAKFILTLRKDEEEWFQSLEQHSKRTGPSKLRKIAYGYSMPTEENKQHHIDIYRKHKKEVTTFFRKNNRRNFLILKTNDKNKEKKIYRFLGISYDPLYYLPYPHKNRSS